MLFVVLSQSVLGATIESMEVSPDPVAPSILLTIKAEASADVVIAFATVDFRPTLLMFFPVQLVFDGTYWTGTVPFPGVTFPQGVETIQALASATAIGVGPPAVQHVTITVLPAMPPSITIEAGLDNMNIDAGDSGYVAYAIGFETLVEDAFQVIVEQTVSPDNGGITWISDYPPGGWATSANIGWVINEQVFGNMTGTYELTKRATILETGDYAEVTIVVNVLSGVDEPRYAIYWTLEAGSGYEDNIFLDPEEVLDSTDGIYYDPRSSGSSHTLSYSLGARRKRESGSTYVCGGLRQKAYHKASILNSAKFYLEGEQNYKLTPSLGIKLGAQLRREYKNFSADEGDLFFLPLNNLTALSKVALGYKLSKHLKLNAGLEVMNRDYEESVKKGSLDNTRKAMHGQLEYNFGKNTIVLAGFSFTDKDYHKKPARNNAGKSMVNSLGEITRFRERNYYNLEISVEHPLLSWLTVTGYGDLNDRIDPFQGYYSYDSYRIGQSFLCKPTFLDKVELETNLYYRELQYKLKEVTNGEKLTKEYFRLAVAISYRFMDYLQATAGYDLRTRNTNETDLSRKIYRDYKDHKLSFLISWRAIK
jgi:hypothetical protein